MRKIAFYIIILLPIFFGTGCEKDEIPIEPELNLIPWGNAATEEGMAVKILSTGAFVTGYNELFVEIKNKDGKIVVPEQMGIEPMMHMSEKSHSAPSGISITSPKAINMYPFYVVFVMPSGDMGSWELKVSFQVEGKPHQALVPVDVAMSKNKLVSLVSKADGARLFIALINPLKPQIGVNDFDIGIWTRQNMMDWPATKGLDITIKPEMPSMDHGSPNNVNPVYKGSGIYRGKVNFTMDGLWVVNLSISDKGEFVGNAKFEFEF
jgi:hypothetical protein